MGSAAFNWQHYTTIAERLPTGVGNLGAAWRARILQGTSECTASVEVLGGTEGCIPSAAPGRQGAGVGPVRRIQDPAERALPVTAPGHGEPGCRTGNRAGTSPGRWGAAQARGEDFRGVCAAKKRAWGALADCWVPHDTCDEIMDFVLRWAERTGLPTRRFIRWPGIAPSKIYSWRKRCGQANEHNSKVSRNHWLAESERAAIVGYHSQYPLEGYGRLAFMMLDADVVAVSPSSVYRVLRARGWSDRAFADLSARPRERPSDPPRHPELLLQTVAPGTNKGPPPVGSGHGQTRGLRAKGCFPSAICG